MAKLVAHCPTCGKVAKEDYHTIFKAFRLRVVYLKCGHSYNEKIEESKPWELLEFEGKGGKIEKLFNYQGEGYEFARNSNFRCLIADDPGLGKTWQFLTCLRLHPEILTPCLVILKASLKVQVLKEVLKICGFDFLPQIIENSNDRPVEGFHVYLTTYDLLNRINKKEQDKAEAVDKKIRAELGLMEWDIIPADRAAEIPEVKNPFVDFGFKCVILDEVQQVKGSQSKRTKQVQEICKHVPHVIAASGTPIKNNAGEYFTILNILDPVTFPDRKYFLDNYCETYWNGRAMKIGGIRDMELFKELTKDYIIRRKREEVLKDLPALQRKFIHCEFASAKIEKEYQEVQEEFEDFFYENEGKQDFAQNILARMAKMRHLAGLNKVPFTTEWVIDFINDTEPTRKLVIFTHHKDVSQMLAANLRKEFEQMRKEGSQINDPLLFTSDLNASDRDWIVQNFEHNINNRILIASTLAAGEGINMQFCHDCIVMERQWNPANEEQAEGRFIRIGSEHDYVDANYILSTGTIDEYFTELVEQKRSIMAQTLDGQHSDWNESSLMMELARTLAAKGSKRWRLQ